MSMEQRRQQAIAYLRERNIYVLDKGTPKPNWGRPDPVEPPRFDSVYFKTFPAICAETEV